MAHTRRECGRPQWLNGLNIYQSTQTAFPWRTKTCSQPFCSTSPCASIRLLTYLLTFLPTYLPTYVPTYLLTCLSKGEEVQHKFHSENGQCVLEGWLRKTVSRAATYPPPNTHLPQTRRPRLACQLSPPLASLSPTTVQTPHHSLGAHEQIQAPPLLPSVRGRTHPVRSHKLHRPLPADQVARHGMARLVHATTTTALTALLTAPGTTALRARISNHLVAP